MKMKKVTIALFAALCMLAGCASQDTSDEKVKEEAKTSQDEQTSSINQEAFSNKEVSSDDLSSSVLFVPQKSDIDQGFTVENDEALKEMEKLILETDSDELGIEGDVAIQFTGLYLEGEDTTNVIFLIINKTDITMVNMEFELSMGTADDGFVIQRHPIRLTEDVFGVLETNTAMPLYITIKSDKKELLYGLIKERNEKITLEGFIYEEINSESQNISSVSTKRNSLFLTEFNKEEIKEFYF